MYGYLSCAIFQSLDPEIDAQIKARYRDKFKLDSEKESVQQPTVSAFLVLWFVFLGLYRRLAFAGILYSGSTSVRHRILNVCECDILQSVCGNYTKFTT